MYQFDVLNNKSLPDVWRNKQCATYDWLRGFMNRHKTVSLRTPESTSLSRSTAFNKTNVSEFFANLRIVMEENKFGPEAIYNVDETDLTTVHKPCKIIAERGEKQVAKMTSGERGTLVTLCCCVSAMGTAIPPFLVFPRVRVKEHMKLGAPPGTEVAAHPSGWMTTENFDLFLQHFARYSNCNLERKVLLVMDNHESHISPKGIQFCKDSGIVLLTLPPHTSHRLQPLDRTVFGPLKSYYNQSCDEWMINHPGQPISIYDIPQLIGKAFPRAVNPLNIQNGFLNTGIFPFNPLIFSESDFLCAEVTNRPNPEVDVDSEPTPSRPTSTPSEPTTVPLQSTSEVPSNDGIEYRPTTVTPEQIRPYPKAQPRKGRGGKRPVKTRILTSTPVKKEIEKHFEERLRKKPKFSLRSKQPPVSQREPSKKKKKRDSSSSDSDISIHLESEEECNLECLTREADEHNTNNNYFSGDNTVLNVGDYVIVKFATKSNIYHYVGKIVNKDETLEETEVKFFRKKGNGFCEPDVEDISMVPNEDIQKIPPPVNIGGTERSRDKLTFPVDFSSGKFENIC